MPSGKMNEETLEARLAAVLEHAPCTLAILSADGTPLLANGRAAALAASPEMRRTLRAAAPARRPVSFGGAQLIPFGQEGEWLLREAGGDEARLRFLGDALQAVTQGKLRLAFDPEDLPPRLPAVAEVRLDTDAALAPLRRAVWESGTAAGMTDERARAATVAADEVAMNAIVHGGGGRAVVGSTSETPGGGTIQVWVEDSGPGIRLDELPRSALVAGYSTRDSMGMGLYLTIQESDRVFVRTGVSGTVVVVEMDRLPTPPLWLQRAGFNAEELAGL
jgi:anti-sigma regulatory factor (Ser/Thr protein kinase)